MPHDETGPSGRAFWERNASRYDGSMALLGGPIPMAAARAVEAVRGAGRVLEVACGTGLFSEAVASVVGELVATDYAAAMVARTRARVAGASNVRCEVRDLYDLGSDLHDFVAVLAANVLHLLPDLEGGLAAMRAALHPGGHLVVPTYCHAQTAVSRTVSSALALVSFPGRRRFDLAGLSAAVGQAGFAVERTELLPGLLPIGFVCARREG